ncbi:hypothetical protein FN846DRAFT_906115 [Sphaerosporella brunnea]|uniref:Uncharacterized protein n=1 Tax=Sphaerosporella brunnea TaxID=1250544 RepID=A0A5J5EZ61_9PEZI|nr:hypothetical protein FN846DRAFT_906115 [Sphaerosporella brunnea]
MGLPCTRNRCRLLAHPEIKRLIRVAAVSATAGRICARRIRELTMSGGNRKERRLASNVPSSGVSGLFTTPTHITLSSLPTTHGVANPNCPPTTIHPAPHSLADFNLSHTFIDPTPSMMTLAKHYAEYEVPAPRTTDAKTHMVIANFICNKGCYKAYQRRDCREVVGGIHPGIQPHQDFRQRDQEGHQKRNEDQLQALPGQINDVLDEKLFPRLSKQDVDVVIKTNHYYAFGTSMVSLEMSCVWKHGILDVPPSPLNLAALLDVPLAQQQQQDQNWAAQQQWQRPEGSPEESRGPAAGAAWPD